MPIDHNMSKKRYGIILLILNFLLILRKGSPHTTRGIAVDLTLTKNDIELDMGTDFDDFTEKAFHLSKNSTY